MKTFISAKHALSTTERFIDRWGVLLLCALALAYYSAYFNSGLNLGGEGGTTAVYAMRLMEGQRPIVDTFLGYNLLWFAPIVWLFHFTGPDYLALRSFFFAICLLTALLAWATVRRVTRSSLLAFAVGTIAILIPGMIFRNYMALMPVANQLVMVSAFLLPVRSFGVRIALIAVSGAVLGLTFLIRIEVGLLMSFIWIGLLVLYPLAPAGRFAARMKEAALGGFAGLAAFLVVHAPFAMDAHHRGYAREFLGQYSAFVGLFRWELEKEISAIQTQPAKAVPAPTGATIDPPSPSQASPDGRRKRPPIQEVVTGKKSRDRYFAAAIYLPVALTITFVIAASIGWVVSMYRRNLEQWTDCLTSLVLVGCSLTLLPQYLFFRPDTPHITEFMVPFLVAISCSAALLVRACIAHRTRLLIVGASVATVCLGVQVWVHFGHAWPKESAGTIAADKPQSVEFLALNGVKVRLEPERAAALSGLQTAIVSHSRPEDWVACLPYSPTINFMTDRPSYLWDLYTDNTMAGADFDKYRIAEVKKYQPAVIVIDHRAINNSEASRFPNWAPVFYAFIRENFSRVGEFAGNEVFVRPAVSIPEAP